MKTHNLIILVALACLLMLVSACGKKSLRGVSGGEDLFSSESNHDVTGEDQDLFDESLAQLGEAVSGDGSDAGPVEALSAADLRDEDGGIGLGRQKGSASGFPASTSNDGPDSSEGAFDTEHDKAMPRTLMRDQLSASEGSSAASASHENARRDGAHFSKALGDVFFAYDSWRLSEQSHRILESNAKWLKAHSHARITIEGHCDERGTQAYNYVLGERRAEAAKQYLSNLGVSSSQMAVVSYGKDRPVCHVFSAACFQSNRRAHFSIDMNTVSRD